VLARRSLGEGGYNPKFLWQFEFSLRSGPHRRRGCAPGGLTQGFKIVGAVDIDHAKIGLDSGRSSASTRSCASASPTTRSRHQGRQAGRGGALHQLVAQEGDAANRAGTRQEGGDCLDHEELSYPVGKNRALAKKIDALAKRPRWRGRHGVNPARDGRAPITLTGICERVYSIRVDRVQDARTAACRSSKRCSGLTKDSSPRGEGGHRRHVGLTESVTMIADSMGWKLDKITDSSSRRSPTKAVKAT